LGIQGVDRKRKSKKEDYFEEKLVAKKPIAVACFRKPITKRITS
jgi:hypothetical protein